MEEALSRLKVLPRSFVNTEAQRIVFVEAIFGASAC